MGPLTARDYSKVMRNARDTAARTFFNEAIGGKSLLQTNLFCMVAASSPAARDCGNDAAKRVHVARVDNFSGRM